MGLLRSRSRSQQRFEILMNVCPDDIFWTTEYFVTKPGTVMQHHKPECHAEKLVPCVQCQGHSDGDAASWARVLCGILFVCCCYLQGQGHSKGLYDQNMTLSIIFSELLIPWQPNLVWWYIIISQSVLLKKKKKRNTTFRVTVTVKGKNVNVCPDDIGKTTQHFVTRLGFVMHHYARAHMIKL